ncbi:tyrosine-type recombinase/integrase [Marinobacter salicampi]|uniref:tyrosine-type recombinase/integrase n=1 Tax=Marinobacter salicampi TaxID=435907 RepID=UPI00140DBF19|nr:site-specific integrase [Marinobacter salicampi]
MPQPSDLGAATSSFRDGPFPIQHVAIDWEELIRKRPSVVRNVAHMPYYLLKPEVTALLQADKHPMYRLILDVMWTTGAKVAEVLGLTPERIIDSNDLFGVYLKAKRATPGRPNRLSAPRCVERFVPIVDELLQDRLQTYLCAGHFRQREHLFSIAPQTLNRHIHNLANTVGFPSHRITSTTFRHSFAVNLLLHGRPLDYASRLLGHEHLNSTRIYMEVLTVTDREMMNGIEFH